MSLALYPSDAATAAPSDSPALRPAQPAPTLVEGQGCCQDKEEANPSKLGLRPHHPRQGEPEDLLPDAEKRCVTTSPTTIQHFTIGLVNRPSVLFVVLLKSALRGLESAPLYVFEMRVISPVVN